MKIRIAKKIFKKYWYTLKELDGRYFRAFRRLHPQHGEWINKAFSDCIDKIL